MDVDVLNAFHMLNLAEKFIILKDNVYRHICLLYASLFHHYLSTSCSCTWCCKRNIRNNLYTEIVLKGFYVLDKAERWITRRAKKDARSSAFHLLWNCVICILVYGYHTHLYQDLFFHTYSYLKIWSLKSDTEKRSYKRIHCLITRPAKILHPE